MKIISRLLLLTIFLAACGPVTPAMPQPEVSGTYEYQDFAYDIVWSQDEALVALTTLTGLYVYDVKTYAELFAFKQDGGWGAVFGKNYLAAFNNQGVTVWELERFREVLHVDGSFASLAFSPDDETIALAEENKISLIELPSGKVKSTFEVEIAVADMKFKNAERLIVANSFMDNVQEWDLVNQKSVRKFEFPRPVITLRLSSDASLVLVDYGMTGFQLWDVATGRIHHNYGDIVSASGWQRLSGDNKYAVVWGYAYDGQKSGMSVWDLDIHMKTWEFATPYVNGDGWRNGSLNSDGSILAAGDNQGYVYFYNMQDGSEIGKFYLPYKYVVQKG